MYTCAGLIIYKSNCILLNISYQNEHLECGQNGAATAIPTALQRAGVIPTMISDCALMSTNRYLQHRDLLVQLRLHVFLTV